jgi:hypothetical protein
MRRRDLLSTSLVAGVAGAIGRSRRRRSQAPADADPSLPDADAGRDAVRRAAARRAERR